MIRPLRVEDRGGLLMHVVTRGARRAWVLALAGLVGATVAACGGSSDTASTGTGGGGSTASGGKVDLTFWYWGEDDAPGANNWLAATVKSYEAANPNVTITVVPQATDTFTATFATAAAAKSGPDIGAQWATGPVLTQVWNGAITAISDLVPADETKHWLNTSENTYNGKIWAMPVYLIGIPWVANKDLLAQAGIAASPTTWPELIADCTALRAKGITPFAFGNDTYWTTQLMLQSVNSVDDVVQASIGKKSYTDPEFADFEKAWQQMAQAKCFNDDVASVPMSKGTEQFAAGKAAMTVGTDGNVRTWAKDLGADKLLISKWPLYGNGPMKDVYNATQSTSYFVTSWSKHQKEAAAFLAYLHSAAIMDAWYTATGTPPADDRFDTAKITGAVDKQLYTFNTTGQQVWLQNFFPPEVDANGNAPAQQLVLGGQGDAAAAATTRQNAASQWRAQKPDEVKNWSNFHPGG
jgi:ABC-type glycerol-3-phosphate transport system substrate-binding protein